VSPPVSPALPDFDDLSRRYAGRLRAEQLAWLAGGAGVIQGVPVEFEPGRLEDYQADVAEGR
jgi:hypothetical protein